MHVHTGEKKNVFFFIKWRKSKFKTLWVLLHCIIYIKMFPQRATQNLSHLSAPEITHTISAFVCLPWVTAHQLPGPVDNCDATHRHTHTEIHRLHCHPDLCTSIIITHSRNSNSSSYFRAEEHCTNFPWHYTAQTKQGTWKSIFVIFVYWLWHWRCFT